MPPERNRPAPHDGAVPLAGPLTARSVIASTLLGTHPPSMPARALVRSGALFDIPEGTVRVALSRMVATGELTVTEGRYALAGHLLSRQGRQDQSRRGTTGGLQWTGRWEMAVVQAVARPAAQRASLRDAMVQLRLAELREGVWMRPANLPVDRPSTSKELAAAACHWFDMAPPPNPTALAAQLWDLEAWADRARILLREMRKVAAPLERGRADRLPAAFTLSAAVLRHLQADPILPVDLLPASWPGSPLRTEFDEFDGLFTTRWRAWLRQGLG